MHMINKNREGVTLIILIVTIIVLVIIVGVTLNYGLSEIHDVYNKKTESELSIVQEAIMQRYALTKSSNQLGMIADPIESDVLKSNDVNRPNGFVGRRIADPKTSIIDEGFSEVTLMSDYSKNDADKKYEEYYYLLDENDLQELGVEKGENSEESDGTNTERSYIVNYLTGEVFDIDNKKYYKTSSSEGNPIYTQPTDISTQDNKTYDFNDD